MIRSGTFNRVASVQSLKTEAIYKNTSIDDMNKKNIYYICIIKIKLASSNAALLDFVVPTICQEPMYMAPKELINRKMSKTN